MAPLTLPTAPQPYRHLPGYSRDPTEALRVCERVRLFQGRPSRPLHPPQARSTVNRQGRPEGGDRWVAFLERAAPWIVGALVLGIAVFWLLAAILGASWARS
jgi:hypothetical protein